MPIIIDQNGRREVAQIEYDAYIESLPIRWNKVSNIAIINQLHTELFNKILEDYNYLGIAELNLWSQNPAFEYYNEANSIINWYISTYKLIEDYSLNVTELNYINPEVFIDNLPKLNL